MRNAAGEVPQSRSRAEAQPLPGGVAQVERKLHLLVIGALVALGLWLGFGAPNYSLGVTSGVVFFWALVFVTLVRQTLIPLREQQPKAAPAENLRPAEAAEPLDKSTPDDAGKVDIEFLKRMSLEVRSPLNNILGTTSLVLNSQRLEPEDRKFLEGANRSAHTLLAIIDDILDFSKLEAGEMALRETSFDPRELIGDVAEVAAAEAVQNGVEVIPNISPDVPAVLAGDLERVRQVLVNLVSNAVKYTPKGQIAIRLHAVQRQPERGRFRFEVEDTGVGIVDSEKERLFEPFARISTYSLKRQDPAGLGLAVCKTLVEKMDGALGFESEVGKGSLFWVELPLTIPAVSPREVPLEPHRILVAEGNATVRWVLRQHLEHWGLECVDAEDVPTAIAASEQAGKSKMPFHAAVIASEVIELAPERLVNALRKQPGQEDMPLIVMMRPDEEEATIDAKFQINKPLRTSELYNSLAELFLARRRGMDRSLAFQRSKSEPRILDILLVEDNEINQVVGTEIVEELGHRPRVAGNGAIALEMLQKQHFDVVLMDCQMPFVDGYEATRRIRELPGEVSKIPIFALTAHALIGERAKVLAAGMDDYLSKPLSDVALVRLLRLWVPSNRAHLPVVDPSARRSPKAMELFRSTIVEQVEAIGTALEQSDTEAARRCAHRAKNSCLALGAERLAYTCKELQGLSDAEMQFGGLARELLQVAKDEIPLTLMELDNLGPTPPSVFPRGSLPP